MLSSVEQNRDWLVTATGTCEPCPSLRDWDLLRDHYYLHQFLSDILELLAQAPQETEEWQHLPQIRRHVRQLMLNSYWLRTQIPVPDPKTGIGVQILYDEIGYPLTVETVAYAPGVQSPIHNHGTWGAVAILQGQEQHTFWRWHGDRLEPVGTRCFSPGEIVSFAPEAIHQITALGSQPSVTFNLYGDLPGGEAVSTLTREASGTLARSRFQFDPATGAAKPF